MANPYEMSPATDAQVGQPVLQQGDQAVVDPYAAYRTGGQATPDTQVLAPGYGATGQEVVNGQQYTVQTMPGADVSAGQYTTQTMPGTEVAQTGQAAWQPEQHVAPGVVAGGDAGMNPALVNPAGQKPQMEALQKQVDDDKQGFGSFLSSLAVNSAATAAAPWVAAQNIPRYTEFMQGKTAPGRNFGVAAGAAIGDMAIDHLFFGNEKRGFATNVADFAATPLLAFAPLDAKTRLGVMLATHVGGRLIDKLF